MPLRDGLLSKPIPEISESTIKVKRSHKGAVQKWTNVFRSIADHKRFTLRQKHKVNINCVKARPQRKYIEAPEEFREERRHLYFWYI